MEVEPNNNCRAVDTKHCNVTQLTSDDMADIHGALLDQERHADIGGNLGVIRDSCLLRQNSSHGRKCWPVKYLI